MRYLFIIVLLFLLKGKIILLENFFEQWYSLKVGQIHHTYPAQERKHRFLFSFTENLKQA
jgi:hypothetical protein